MFALDLAARNRDVDVDSIYPRTAHPVVRNHPVTGAPILFVCRNQTDSIVGLAPDESEELLSALFVVLYDSSHVFEHTWRAGDVVIWDNLAVQHGRADIATHGPRVLQRVARDARHRRAASRTRGPLRVELPGSRLLGSRRRAGVTGPSPLAYCYLSWSSWKDTAFDALQSNVPAFFG